MITESTQSRALELTKRMVRCRSVTRSEGEREFALLLHGLLEEVGHGVLEHGLHPVVGDPWSRSVPWALLRGEGPGTVVLLSHFDTVDTGEYGSLRPHATEPDDLRAQLLASADELDALTAEHLALGDRWLFGRGAVDMKSGIAAHLVALELLCARAVRGERLPGNVLFVSAPDEESESAGMLAAVGLLTQLQRERGLELLGAINTDYTSSLYPGDEQKVLYTGTGGKLLVGVYVRGVETHAGEPYLGYDANLLCAEIVRAISMRAELANAVGDDVAAPPVSLKASDLKEGYDVQTPFEAYAYFNYLTYSLSPEETLHRVASVASDALAEAVRRVHSDRVRWCVRAGLPAPPAPPVPQTLEYAELWRRAVENSGLEAFERRLSALNADLVRQGADARARSVQLVRETCTSAGLQGPAAVVYLSPPYYPHVRCEESSGFTRAVRHVAASHGATVRSYYPYISDMSYLSLRGAGDLSQLKRNMPLWSDEARPGSYSLPLDAIRALDLDVANIGVWGHGAHKREERVDVQYSCGELPRMVLETVLRTLEG